MLLLAAVGGYALHLWGGPGPAKETVTVSIPQGASLYRAANELEKAGAIRSARLFVVFAKVLGGSDPIKAGDYRLPAHLSESDVLARLQGGKTIQLMFTVRPGFSSLQVQEELMKTEGLTGEIPVPAEGSLMPDTYAYSRGDTRASVIIRSQKAMTDYLAKAWAKRKPGIAVSTPEEAIILASIVEKETGKPEERRMVAGVYSNRLKRNMKLEADPTVIYPTSRGKPIGRRILRSELDAVNDYNTYTMVGLPKGPITNPGAASIDAVLDPAETNAIFFVADGTGGHIFSDTYEQHQANVEKWRALRRAKGEM